jgi:L-fuconolactonase
MIRIDAHQHCWQINDCKAWLTSASTAVMSTFGESDVADVFLRHGVSKTVMVQTSESLEDCVALLELAQQHPFIGAVVGWTPLPTTGAAEQVDWLARYPKLRGLRVDILDRQWNEDRELIDVVEIMCRHALSFDALVSREQLPKLYDFAVRFPNLKIAIVGNGWNQRAGMSFPWWHEQIRQLSTLPNVYCKLTGFMSVEQVRWSVPDIVASINVIIGWFGASRVMWGSQLYPRSTGPNYAEWINTSEKILAQVDPLTRAAVFSDNAARFYGIEALALSQRPSLRFWNRERG